MEWSVLGGAMLDLGIGGALLFLDYVYHYPPTLSPRDGSYDLFPTVDPTCMVRSQSLIVHCSYGSGEVIPR